MMTPWALAHWGAGQWGSTDWGWTLPAYLALLVLVGLERLLELRISKRNQRRLAGNGIRKVREPHFRWMVALHAGVLIAAGAEVLLLHRPFLIWLAAPMAVLFLIATATRLWVIRTMSGHWNVEVMDSTQLGVVTGGPYRWVRHPNYDAVVLELFSLPLIHTAWTTAVVASLANLWILKSRLAVEDEALLSSAVYRSAMGSKPRFLPRFF
jgi:methyltransferase